MHSNELDEGESHLVASFKDMFCLLQKVNHHLLGQERLSMGVNAGAKGQVSALSYSLPQLLDTAGGERGGWIRLAKDFQTLVT